MTPKELINLFSDHDQAVPDLNTSDVNNSSLSPSELPIEWFAAKVNGYYKNNLKIGHLNINSVFGKSDEAVNLLDKCAFDILLAKVRSMDLFLPHYSLMQNTVSYEKTGKKEAADY